MQTTIEELEKQTKSFADANDELTDLKREMSSEFETIRSKYIRKIKAAVEKVIKCRSELTESIDNGRELFTRPKTLTMNAVKIGLQKAKDKIEYDDELKVIALIEKIYEGDLLSDLIITTKKPSKDEIIKLPISEINKIKCRLVQGTDSVFIKTIDTEIDKFVSNLMKESEAS